MKNSIYEIMREISDEIDGFEFPVKVACELDKKRVVDGFVDVVVPGVIFSAMVIMPTGGGYVIKHFIPEDRLDDEAIVGEIRQAFDAGFRNVIGLKGDEKEK